MSEEILVKIEVADEAANSNYMLYDTTEILHVLRTLQKKRLFVCAYFGTQGGFASTTVVGIDEARQLLYLDYSNQPSQNRAMLAANRLVCVSTLDKIKIQFVCENTVDGMWEGHPALQVPLPRKMLKLQRRDYYRLTLPRATPLICTIALDDQHKIGVSLVDISLGGVGIINYPSEVNLHSGQIYENCKIVLPDVGTLIVDLQIKNCFEVTLKNNQVSHRSGCQFLRLPPSMQNMIQRYINKLERERRALLLQ